MNLSMKAGNKLFWAKKQKIKTAKEALSKIAEATSCVLLVHEIMNKFNMVKKSFQSGWWEMLKVLPYF